MQHENLWAPWRMAYIQQFDPRNTTAPSRADSACFLCEAIRVDPDTDQARRRFVLLRDDRGVIMLNLYPYTNGHLLVAPLGHLSDLTDLSQSQRADLMALTVVAQRLLQAAVNPQGINIGINLGRCAGAGLPGHLHVHVVPRWSGDTNFMQTIGRIRVVPEALEASFDRLTDALKKLSVTP